MEREYLRPLAAFHLCPRKKKEAGKGAVGVRYFICENSEKIGCSKHKYDYELGEARMINGNLCIPDNCWENRIGIR